MQTARLGLQILAGGVNGHPHAKARGAAHLAARDVMPLLHLGDHPHQPDRVDVIDARRLAGIPERGRIASERQDVAHAQGVGTDEVRLEPHQVPVAGGQVQHGLDAGLRLDQVAGRQGVHTHPGHGAIGDIDQIHLATVGQGPGVAQQRCGAETPGRRQLHRRDKLARREFLVHAGGLGSQFLLGLARGRAHDHRLRWHSDTAMQIDVHRLAHRRDVIGPGAATPPQHTDAGLEKIAHAGAKIGRVGEIDQPPCGLRGHAGVRHSGDIAHACPQHLAGDTEDALRPHAAVGPDHIRAQILQRARHLDRRLSPGGAAVLIKSRLRDHRQVAHLVHGLQGDAQHVQIRKGLQNEQVHPAIDKACRLLAIEGARLISADLTERRQRAAERADRACDKSRAAGDVARIARDASTLSVDLAHLPLAPVGGQLGAVGAKGIGLDDLGARRQIIHVHALDQVGVSDVDSVIALAGQDAAGIKLGAHGTVAQDWALLETGKKGMDRHRHAPKLFL